MWCVLRLIPFHLELPYMSFFAPNYANDPFFVPNHAKFFVDRESAMISGTIKVTTYFFKYNT
jgi:hypothetical protein